MYGNLGTAQVYPSGKTKRPSCRARASSRSLNVVTSQTTLMTGLLKELPEPGHYHWRRVSQNYLNGLPKPPSSRMTCGSRIHSRVCCKRYSGPTSQSESKKSSPYSCPSWLTQKAQQPRDFIMPRWPEEEAPFLACVKRGTHDWGLSKSIS
jgi:hypothetical protein